VSLTISPVRDQLDVIVEASTIARDVSQQRQSASRTGFLAEASAALSSSLDYETTLKAVAHLAVPAIADWCAVDILREGRLDS